MWGGQLPHGIDKCRLGMGSDPTLPKLTVRIRERPNTILRNLALSSINSKRIKRSRLAKMTPFTARSNSMRKQSSPLGYLTTWAKESLLIMVWAQVNFLSFRGTL